MIHRLTDKNTTDTLPAELVEVLQMVQTLTTEKKPFSYWIPVILEVVRSLLFGEQDDTLREKEKMYRLLKECGEQLTDLPAGISPMVSSTETMRFLLHLLDSETLVEPSQPDTIAMYGWLELPLDDAAATVVTGMVDGAIPSSQSADMFLPNSLRKELGILDNDRRFARDAYAMSVLLETHKTNPKHLHFTFPQRNLQDDPQLPSRLFFATDGDTIARRVLKLFNEVDEQNDITGHSSSSEPMFPTTTMLSGKPPQLPPLERPVDSMRVTEFKDYIACPYRYFLRHRMTPRLEVLDDKAEELDAAAFGTLVHAVLEKFGKNRLLATSTDVQEISDWLTCEMWRQAMAQYGEFPRAIVTIQMEQLRQRLAAFAKWQADWAAKGNTILHVEFQPPQPETAVLSVDDKPLKLRGRIDRIDYNAAKGCYYLLDYKTSNTADKPEKTHYKSGRWVDLQLPLYRHLVRQAIPDWQDGDLYDTTKIQCGYVVLPKDTDKTGILLAKWSAEDLRSADEAAREVVRGIWSEKFWPPTSPPPPFSDDFAPICGDR